MSRRLAYALLICAPLAACELPQEPLTEVPTLRIADAAHNGDQHFYFLPPLAWQPEYSGEFDPAAQPEVSICVLAGSSCSDFVTYSTTTESAGELVQADPASGFFHVNWHTDRFDLSVNTVYRIRVRVEADEVGYLDVLLVANRSQMRSGGRDGLISLVDGRTAPIKFRIEKGLGTPNEPDPPPEPEPIPEGAIAGVVTDADGVGLEGIMVSALTTGMVNTVVAETQTQGDGTYVLSVPDTYPDVLVRFEDLSGVHRAECWDNVDVAFCTWGATPVSRGSSDINAVLQPVP